MNLVPGKDIQYAQGKFLCSIGVKCQRDLAFAGIAVINLDRGDRLHSWQRLTG